MNCSRLQLENSAAFPDVPNAHERELEHLERIARILSEKQIDLGQLSQAVAAVSGFAVQLCQRMTESAFEFRTLSDAIVLAGRKNIQVLLDCYLHAARTNISCAPGGLYVVPAKASSQEVHASSANVRIRLAEL